MLLRRFALVSVAATAALCLTLGVALQYALNYYTLHLYRNEVARTLLANADHHLTRDVVAAGGSLLAEHLDMVAAGAGARAVRLYDTQGRPLWPPGRTEASEPAAHRRFLARALAGERVVVMARATALPAGRSARHVLETYLPLVGAGEVYAVLETEVPADLLVTVRQRLRNVVLSLLAGGLLILWTLLYALVRSASRTIEAQQAELADANLLLKQRFEDLVSIIIAAVDAKDCYTFGHSLRVAAISRLIGQELRLTEDDLATLELGALLHDVGKIGVSEAVLRKCTRLNALETLEMRRHPAIGMALLDGVRSLPPGVREIVGHHHERPDGRGYPAGLRGNAIPLLARIVAVADCYDAMRSERPYRQALAPETAWEELRRYAGTQFDERVVAAALRIAPAIESSLYSTEPAFAACTWVGYPAPANQADAGLAGSTGAVPADQADAVPTSARTSVLSRFQK